MISRKRRSIDVGDGTVRAMDLVRGGHEPASFMLEDDADLQSEVPPLIRVVEGVPLHNVEAGTGGPSVEIPDVER